MIVIVDSTKGRVINLTPEEWGALLERAQMVVEDYHESFRLASEIHSADHADLPQILRGAADCVQEVMDLESACRKLIGLEPRAG